MFKLERAADVVQGFGMPDKQRAVDFKVVVKCVDDLALHFIVKVDDNVAAENNLRFFNSLELFPLIEG